MPGRCPVGSSSSYCMLLMLVQILIHTLKQKNILSVVPGDNKTVSRTSLTLPYFIASGVTEDATSRKVSDWLVTWDS